MRWIVGLVVVGQVAADTGCRSRIVIHTIVALVTSDGSMCAGKGIVSIVNGECGRFPAGDGGMAIGTRCGNMGNGMVWVRGGVVIGQVTAGAIFGKAAEAAVGMAPGTIKVGMTQGKRKKIMVHVYGCPGKTVNRMALNTIF